MIVKNTGNKVTVMPVDYFPLVAEYSRAGRHVFIHMLGCLKPHGYRNTLFFFFPFLTPHLQQQYAFRHAVLLWTQKIAPVFNQLRSSFTSCIVLYFASFDFVVLRGLLVLRYNLLSRSDMLLKNMHEVKRLWCNKLQFRAPHAGGRVPNCVEDWMKMLFHKLTELILPGGSVKEKWQFAPRN